MEEFSPNSAHLARLILLIVHLDIAWRTDRSVDIGGFSSRVRHYTGASIARSQTHRVVKTIVSKRKEMDWGSIVLRQNQREGVTKMRQIYNSAQSAILVTKTKRTSRRPRLPATAIGHPTRTLLNKLEEILDDAWLPL